MSQKILITGSAGMVGKNLSDALVNFKDFKVFPTYYDITIPKEDFKSIHKIINKYKFLNILNAEALEDLLVNIKPDIIIHLAAQSRPDISLSRPLDTIKTNLLGTINIVNSNWVRNNRPWIINFSSSAVYGDIEWEEPVTEQSPTRPITTYGVSKLSAERYLHANHEGISTSLRLFNCSGPYKTKDLISDICKRLIFEDENNLKIGCLNTKRHFLHVSDVVEVIKRLLSIKKEERNKFNREFNLAPSHKNLNNVIEVIQEFENLIGHKVNIKKDKSLFRKKDESIIWGNSELLSNNLKWKSIKSIKDIIKDSYFYMQNLHKQNE